MGSDFSEPIPPEKALLEYIPYLNNNQVDILTQKPLIFLKLCATLMTR